MENPLIMFLLALLNVAGFEVLYGLFKKILPQYKADWVFYYWMATFILCFCSRLIDASNPRNLLPWIPVLFVAIIHDFVSDGEPSMPIDMNKCSPGENCHNPSSFSNRCKNNTDGGEAL